MGTMRGMGRIITGGIAVSQSLLMTLGMRGLMFDAAPNWTVHFCGRFNVTAASSKTFAGNGTTLSQYGQQASVSGTERLGGVFAFNETAVSSRVGVSFISSERACEYLEDEIPADTTLESLVSASQETWNDQVFSKVTTTETNTTYLTQLYSSLYGMHIIPSNRTGDNPLWKSDEPYYDDCRLGCQRIKVMLT